MKTVRKGTERGSANLGWLRSWHSFSFGRYVDEAHTNFGPLRVINEDWVAPNTGFAPHSHQHMEIITYMLSGELTHQDSLGSHSTLQQHQVQYMSAGTGIKHSEMNRSKDPVHLLQIWIEPNRYDLKPAYQNYEIRPIKPDTQLKLIGTHDAEKARAQQVMHIHQNVELWAGKVPIGQLSLSLSKERMYYLHVASGGLQTESIHLNTGDALKISEENGVLELMVSGESELLWFDLPVSI